MPKSEKVKINVKDRVEDDTIDLSLSELSDVPVRDIANFKRATILDLSNNKIISLGKNFGILTHLTKLDLSKNQIKSLPEDISNLRNLRHLDLYDNRIEHLPLGFGNLHNLRYLDLKANPLAPALGKIVGPCLTTKDCNEAAKNTVRFLAKMQLEVEKAKEKLKEESDAQIEVVEDVKRSESQKLKKKKNKTKPKKKQVENSSPKQPTTQKSASHKTKHSKAVIYNESQAKSGAVFKTLFVFFFLLVINILMLYMITVKNPEIAEKIVTFIPPYYRELILIKTEDVRMNFIKVSEWLQKFRTPSS